ncbi:MAG: hypothetical protein Q4D89_09110 [Arachnia propionica]|uniref:hypothetical protein n=1 Tax=Arachnia propionica TaxID=1750 RepID=UPI0026FF40C0|nr:hypothetical protein [Arachnia propionica]
MKQKRRDDRGGGLMRRVSFLSLAVGSLAATLGPGVWGHLFGEPEVDRGSSRNRELIEMPTEFADTFSVDLVEGWVSEMHPDKAGAFCWVWDAVDTVPDPGPALKIEHIHNSTAEHINSARHSEVPMLSYDEVVRQRSAMYGSGGYRGFVLMPERIIGGEAAVGMGYRSVAVGRRVVRVEYYIIRHDGLWVFTLFSGINRDVIDPDTYRVLDTFHWTGPYVEPSPEPSASEDE